MEAKAVCAGLFQLDALHVLDAEMLSPTLHENLHQERERLHARLSSRERKKRKKGKRLSRLQRLLFGSFASGLDTLKREPRLGNDLMLNLEEIITGLKR